MIQRTQLTSLKGKRFVYDYLCIKYDNISSHNASEYF